ncbi:hypothetical protein [Actinokineospora iranica]|uniref:Uncharacterized protein n=1 Tax=Actinokineospora iranica TaxID=1271860 RepID=A0A1G6XNR9_9PSEU|nr:hypothetical protein [Actinokineospora iranica]SDD79007.1 hypothetical protein SAMN05216174_11816 [Actinokineospora iranica]
MTAAPEVDEAGEGGDTAPLRLRHGRHLLPMPQLAALDTGLFEILAATPAGIAETAARPGTTGRAAGAMPAVEAALGFLDAPPGGGSARTERARAYLLRESPLYSVVSGRRPS